MSTTLHGYKGLLASLLGAIAVMLFAAALTPAAAYADSIVGAQADAGGLAVYTKTQTGVDEKGEPTYGDAQLVKEFSNADLVALASQNADAIAYGYQSGSTTGILAAKAGYYVMLNQVLTEAGIKASFLDGGFVQVNDGALINNALCNGFAVKDSSTSDSIDNGDSVGAAFVLAQAKAEFSGTMTAGDALTAALGATASDEGCPMLCYGKQKKGKLPKLADFAQGATKLTLYVPVEGAFVVRTQVGSNEPQLAKWFTSDELKALAAQNTEPQYYLMNTNVRAVTSYVTTEQLLAASGLSFIAGDSLTFSCTDGPYTKAADMTYEALTAGQFYPAYDGGTDTNITDAESVPAVLAFKSGSAAITSTASVAKEEALAKATKTDIYPTFCSGTTENFFLTEKKARPGSDFPSYITVLTVCFNSTKDLSYAQAIIANQTYTGQDLTPVPTIKVAGIEFANGLDYTVSYKNNRNAGTATALITGKGHCSGTLTAFFKIDKANQTVTAKKKTVKLKAKKLKKKAQTIKAAKVASGNSASTKITYSLKKANKSKKKFKVAADGKITVKKGLKKGTYKLTITATAGDANYNTATKNFVVTVKVS